MNELVLFTKVSDHHKGEDNAIKRRDLLLWTWHTFGLEIKDRDLRRLYSAIPVVSSRKGVFYPTTTEELLGFKKYLQKKATAIFRRWEMVSRYHKNLLNNGQMSLFEIEKEEEK